MNRKADFLQNESIRIDSHKESNRIDLNRELECSSNCISAAMCVHINGTKVMIRGRVGICGKGLTLQPGLTRDNDRTNNGLRA